MDLLTPTFLIIVSLSSILFRRPFQNFPLDDDFAIYTYRARFASLGFQWKKDLQLIGIPMWKMLLFDKLYGSAKGGVQRIRHLQTAFHLIASLALYGALWSFTHNPWASFTGALLYSFYFFRVGFIASRPGMGYSRRTLFWVCHHSQIHHRHFPINPDAPDLG
jgi:hypothetical protein